VRNTIVFRTLAVESTTPIRVRFEAIYHDIAKDLAPCIPPDVGNASFEANQVSLLVLIAPDGAIPFAQATNDSEFSRCLVGAVRQVRTSRTGLCQGGCMKNPLTSRA
jgi:hypothetical protein